MIGLSFTVGAINHMTPWGGAEAILGNTPFSIAFPTDREFPIVIDMACSVAARGKIMVAAKDHTPIPIDWATDPNGEPTTDPIEALKGFVLPVGGPKGYALTLAVGLLGSMLSGAAFGSEVGHLHEKLGEAQNVGHLFGVLPVALFEDEALYRQRIGKAIQDLISVKRAPGVDRIYMPGEIEYLLMQKHLKEGVPINQGVYEELNALGAPLGLRLPSL